MEYLDFSSVITIIRKYINDERTVVDRNLNEEVKIDQMHLLDQVFASFCDDADSLDFAFDNGHHVHHEMSARLLESGIMEPMLLLKKLKEEKAALDATDTIGIFKDGKSRKATYYDQQLFQTIESVIVQIENDNMPVYLRFLEDVFPYMENYHYYQGMELVLDTLSALLKDAEECHCYDYRGHSR